MFPPYVDGNGRAYPLGRVIMALGGYLGPNTNALALVQAQRLQSPIVLTNVNWLAVGHVDEVFGFLSDREVMVADPALAWQQIIRMANQDAGQERTIRIGTTPNNFHATSLVDVSQGTNFFFSQVTRLDQYLDFDDTRMVYTQGVYAVGDYLLIGHEVAKVVEKTTTNVGGVARDVAILQRHLPFGWYEAHGPAALVRKLTEEFAKNVYGVLGEQSLDERLTDAWAELLAKLQAAPAKKKCPVVFGDHYHEYADSSGMFMRKYVGRVAATANMVNSVLDFPERPGIFNPEVIWSPNPGNRQFRDLFVVAAGGRTVRFMQGADDVAAWDNYHRLMGELHCGSNGKRTLPTLSWWTHSQFNGWGN